MQIFYPGVPSDVTDRATRALGVVGQSGFWEAGITATQNYAASGTLTSLAGTNPPLIMVNPSGATKQVTVKRLSYQLTTTATIQLQVKTAAGFVTTVTGTSLFGLGSASNSGLDVATQAGQPGGTVLDQFSAQANTIYVWDNFFVVLPANSALFIGPTANGVNTANFSAWWTEK